MTRAALVLGLALAVPATNAGTLAAQQPDSTRTPREIFVRTDALILTGFAAATVAARPLDVALTRVLQQPAWQANRIAGRGSAVARVLAFPGALIGGTVFYAVGRLREDPAMSDVALHSVEAVAISNVATYALKGAFGRARPYVDATNSHDFALWRGFSSDDFQSFPSGHTSSAFAMATALTSEASEWRPRSRWVVGGTMYTLATLSGISRIFNNKHWASDVVAGAAVGTATGLAVVRLNHRHPDNPVNGRLLPEHGSGWEIPIVFSIPVP